VGLALRPVGNPRCGASSFLKSFDRANPTLGLGTPPCRQATDQAVLRDHEAGAPASQARGGLAGRGVDAVGSGFGIRPPVIVRGNGRVACLVGVRVLPRCVTPVPSSLHRPDALRPVWVRARGGAFFWVSCLGGRGWGSMERGAEHAHSLCGGVGPIWVHQDASGGLRDWPSA
jgi:hypothetical protein